MNLRITGPAVDRSSTSGYIRVPMHDGVGPVSAYIMPGGVNYRINGERNDAAMRRVRADLLADAIGGEVFRYTESDTWEVAVRWNVQANGNEAS